MKTLIIRIEETNGINRSDEAVTVGVPFPRGAVFDPGGLALRDPLGAHLPVQAQALANWSDGSVKWLLLDFQATVQANGAVTYELGAPQGAMKASLAPRLSLRESAVRLVVDTGRASFFLNRRLARPFDRVVIDGRELLADGGSAFVLTDDRGDRYVPRVQDFGVEAAGPLRATLRFRGELRRSGSDDAIARFVMRLTFYSGTGHVKVDTTLHNPRPAVHPGGLWDLGDSGSIYFKDLSLALQLRTATAARIAWTADGRPLTNHSGNRIEIYQDSSGGENWRSTNHVNRFGRVTHAFRGYRVTAAGVRIDDGLRAVPAIALHGEHGSVAGTIEKFWQNFPKAMEATGSVLTLGLFPRQYNDGFELQGGEQKTHTMYLQFAGPGPEVDLRWVHDRLIPRVTPEGVSDSGACSYLVPANQDPNTEDLQWLEAAVEGPQSFFARREIIDEYGWRHFGDLYADHEAIGHTGETPLVAHYNNQYDVIYGAIVQYLRSGDRRWFELMSDLAKHVIDIDIYHTDEDRPAYNGGLFWHTDHYLDAGTATHRTYSKAALHATAALSYGGGPSNEHNYTSGLMHYYYLTGDEAARQAVLSLADWVIHMDDGSRRLLGSVDRRPTGLCSSTASRDYHGPGRGAGNSLNALLDGYALSHDGRFLVKGEEIIRRCIHPGDDIPTRNLGDPEHRWSYLIFLQALGKYLDLKIDERGIDFMYAYAQRSLLHYAEWMLAQEVPYATILDRVEIPTETWPAQDIRKCVVFHLATKHAMEPLRSKFQKRAEFFFQACIKDVNTFSTRTLTRPMVLLLTNAYVHSYFQTYPDETAPRADGEQDFGRPRRFKPQFAELYWAREKTVRCVEAVKEIGRNVRAIARKGQILRGAHNG